MERQETADDADSTDNMRAIDISCGILLAVLHKEITSDIIGAAMAVSNELKPGLDEKLSIEACTRVYEPDGPGNN